MITDVKLTCDGVPGRTADGLQRVLADRSRILGETTRNAVIATAIDILISLRAATRSAKKRRQVKATVSVVGGVLPGFTGGRSPRRCLRTMSGERWTADGAVRYLTRGVSYRACHVYRVQGEHESVRPYYVVATSAKAAKAFETRRAMGRIRAHGDLAKCALGLAMFQLSTRNVADAASEKAREKAKRLSRVRTAGGAGASGNFLVQVSDELNYATSALRGGAADLDRSVQKAANKIAGRLKNHLHRLGKLSDSVPVPFPEVRGKRG